MAGLRLPAGRGRRLKWNRSAGVVASTACVLAVLAGGGGGGVLSAVAAEGGATFRCETEEDLDGSACRVDMLPDAALADMVYERGFDPEGADRLQLLDAVMQLLDYEYTTGEDLREMEYIPDDGSAAAAAEAAAAELENAAAAAAAAAMAADVEQKAVGGAGFGGANDEYTDFDLGDTTGEGDGEETVVSLSAGGYDEGDEAAAEVIAEMSEKEVGESEAIDESTVLGYAQSLGAEVLSTMKRDLNAVVGLLPAPVAQPIREVAAVLSDTTLRVVVPVLKQAERYTRVLRREAGHAAGRLALRVKDEVCPRVARGAADVFGEAKRRLSAAVKKGSEEEEEEEEGGEETDGVDTHRQ